MPKAINDPCIRAALAGAEMKVDHVSGEVTYRGRPPRLGPDGYLSFKIQGTRVMAHRAVWLSVHPHTPDTLEINHRNGCRSDNRIANLEAVTHQGNLNHAHMNPYAAVAHSAEAMDGNSVDPAWFARVMALAAQDVVTPEEIAALKPEKERTVRPFRRPEVFRGH